MLKLISKSFRIRKKFLEPFITEIEKIEYDKLFKDNRKH